MKKILLLSAISCLGLSMMAQKSNIQGAINYLKDNDIANAKKMIDEATTNESTQSNAKAWLIKGVIYEAISIPKEMMPQMQFVLNDNPYIINLDNANSLKASTPNASKLALEAYSKSMSFDPKYNKEELMPLLQTMVYIGFNNGVSFMNDSKFGEAVSSFKEVSSMADMDGGKFFKGMAATDTIFANSKLYQANSLFQLGNDDETLPLLEECIKNPITQNSDLYIMASDIYEKKGNEAKWMETIQAAKAKYPNDKRIINNEINYYLKNPEKAQEAINKLKEGIAADPKKADLHIILGQSYYNIANPTDANGRPKAKPANAKELEQNALSSYAKAAELEPSNAYVQFYMGLLYYNQAKEATDLLNKEQDDKKYAAMKPSRDALVDKAVPFLEKAKALVEKEKLNDSNKDVYKQVLSGLMQSYNIMNKPEKSAEIQNLLKTVN